LAHLLLRDTQPNPHAKAKEPNALAQLHFPTKPLFIHLKDKSKRKKNLIHE
jgi:hypothetical protein